MAIDPKRMRRILDRYRVEDGRGFRLRDFDPGDTAGLALEKEEARALLAEGTARLAALQDMLYAQDRWALLCLFQAMDAAGKDGAIKHVFSGVNPQGVHVTSFKAPGPLELDHDFLWRHAVALPQRGMIGIHNRSWYEEVLAVRVHPEILRERQKLPPSLVTKRIWEERLEDIAAFERYLSRQGIVVLKFFLNLGKDEQRRRGADRLLVGVLVVLPEAPLGDVVGGEFPVLLRLLDAREEAAARHAPWYVVPATTRRVNHLLSAGTTYQGACRAAVARIAFS